MKKQQTEFERAIEVFRNQGGLLRTSEAMELGIHQRTLYLMRDKGVVENLSRGLYRLAEMPPPGRPDLVTVALKVPKGVICLISALAFFDVTTQIPHEVHVAVLLNARIPRLRYPPIRAFRFGVKAFSAGIEGHEIDGVPVQIYCLEKTVADCFKFRNKIGLDVAIEALKECRMRREFNIDKLMGFARICRVGNVIRPYIEAVF
ncbi:MAG: type IV toxin-antitoxin system AbiEi family antitoxin domain-containing protein [Candidatus Coatesbacteria bacterium]|nr:type IV toxin-antitoxin system AbiEi family antitoxin domain-containing protein [Candidatus Coatesbacteria bacterium]